MAIIVMAHDMDTTAHHRTVDIHTTANSSRIACNTMMLYIRMGIGMVVGLITSRVILDTLGVGDYGIYSVVGSVVAMLDFLNGAMAGATSRFLTYEIGRGNKKQLAQTFSTALIVHIGIAVVVLLLAETVGLWILEYKLVIPVDRMGAARIVYQFSIISAMFAITQVPYNAAIIAHEKMDVYAYVEVTHTFLKLAIVYLLYIGSFDRLIQYGAQMLLVSIGIALFYRYYATKHFAEVSLRLVFSRSIFRRMGLYTLYGLFSSFAFIFQRNAMVMLINMFFGVMVNTAASLAATVSGVVQGFTSNVITAIRPPLIAYYAQDNRQSFLKLFYVSVVVMVFIMSASAVPFILEMDYILDLWLGKAPTWTANMCRISLFAASVYMAETVVNIANAANGNIRNQAICSGILMLIQLPIVYVLFMLIHNPLCAVAVSAIFSFMSLSSTTYWTMQNIPYISFFKVLVSTLKSLLLCYIMMLPVAFMQQMMEQSLLRLIMVFVCYESITLPLGYLLLFDASTKAEINVVWSRITNNKKTL